MYASEYHEDLGIDYIEDIYEPATKKWNSMDVLPEIEEDVCYILTFEILESEHTNNGITYKHPEIGHRFEFAANWTGKSWVCYEDREPLEDMTYFKAIAWREHCPYNKGEKD